MGGSPCQDLSIAGKRAGLAGSRSGLFYVFVDMLKHYKPRYFFFENVASMSKTAKDTITRALGVEPVEINSALVSAQWRKRLYWTNIPLLEIKSENVRVLDIVDNYTRTIKDKKYKSINLTTEETELYYDRTVRLGNINGRTSQGARVYSVFGKCPTLSAKSSGSDAIFMWASCPITLGVQEWERLQTLPDKYTEQGVLENGQTITVSNTQRAKMIGNGWTVKVIEQFFRNIEC